MNRRRINLIFSNYENHFNKKVSLKGKNIGHFQTYWQDTVTPKTQNPLKFQRVKVLMSRE